LSLLFGGSLYASLRRGRQATVHGAARCLGMTTAMLMVLPMGFLFFSSFYARVAWLMISGPVVFCTVT
ncbi:hypothetical protein PMAYCL1PPCAC_15078, partial [Pristionchus mayeri]